MYKTISLLFTMLLFGHCVVQADSGNQKVFGLLNAEQALVESVALGLLDSDTVKEAKGRERFLEAHFSNHPEAGKTLHRTVDNVTYMAALAAANYMEPMKPRITWVLGPGHSHQGKNIPASGVGFDNPDSAHRVITVHPESSYRITGRIKTPGPKNYSIYLYDTTLGDGSKRSFDEALTGFREGKLVLGSDGSFAITIDRHPANDRVNHMQMPTDGRSILIRNLFDDWSVQNPMELAIRTYQWARYSTSLATRTS